MKTLYVCRHGQTFFNTERRMQGQENSDLTDTGLAQARGLADKAKAWPIEALWSSTLGRAVQTIGFTEHALGLVAQQHAGLCERHFGHWQGQLASETPDYASFKKVCYQQLNVLPNDTGESTYQVRSRMVDALLHIAEQSAGDVMIVSHGDAMQCVATQWVSQKSIPNTGGFKLVYAHNTLRWAGWLD